MGAASHSSDVIFVQERERNRIAYDLHDGPAQAVSVALLQVRLLQEREGDELHDGLVELGSTLSKALEEMYGLIGSLGEAQEPDDDIVAKVKSQVDAFSARSDIVPDLQVDGDPRCAPTPHALAIARIVQEALTNVRRHSRATKVDVRLRLRPEQIGCEIVDNGRGFGADLEWARSQTPSVRHRTSYGLRSMRARARLLGGTCEVDSVPGYGTRVVAAIPVGGG
jgi:two-component system, NarL family, sensor histidine kinase DegS